RDGLGAAFHPEDDIGYAAAPERLAEPLDALDGLLLARQDEQVILDKHHPGASLMVDGRDLLGDGLGLAQAERDADLRGERGNAAVVAFADAAAGGDQKVDHEP